MSYQKKQRNIHILFAMIGVGFFVFQFQEFVSTFHLNTEDQLGQAQISVGVSSNKYNILAQQMAEKEQELKDREKYIVERESVVQRSEVGEPRKDFQSSLFVSIASLLLVLILLNFYFDWKRDR